MDEKNIKGVIGCILILVVLLIAILFISKRDQDRVAEIDVSEAEEIIKNREQENKKEEDEEEDDKEKEKEKQLTTFTSFNLEYEITEGQNSSYKVSLDNNKLLTATVYETCTREIVCNPIDETNTLQLNDYEYRVILGLYNRLYTNEWPEKSKESFIIIVARMASGNKVMYNNTTNGWEMYSTYDLDNDGKVLYREFGRYALETFKY